MKESCCQMGEHRQLAGIVTEPDGASRKVAFVLVSAGLLPKSGPFRLYTQLARRLAREGFVTLRFDLGSIGDSLPAYPGLPLRARTELEIKSAVDHLFSSRELDGVVLGGLCSGAEDSFRYAGQDPRVRGVVMIDPFAYRTSGWAWRHLLHRATRRSLRALGLYSPTARPPVAASPGGEARRLVNYKYMDHGESSRILKDMVRRRGHVHFVYTGGMREIFNHEKQLEAMFEGVDFEGRVALDYFPHTDHTQLLEEDRDMLIEAIGKRMAAAFPGG